MKPKYIRKNLSRSILRSLKARSNVSGLPLTRRRWEHILLHDIRAKVRGETLSRSQERFTSSGRGRRSVWLIIAGFAWVGFRVLNGFDKLFPLSLPPTFTPPHWSPCIPKKHEGFAPACYGKPSKPLALEGRCKGLAWTAVARHGPCPSRLLLSECSLRSLGLGVPYNNTKWCMSADLPAASLVRERRSWAPRGLLYKW